MIGKYCMVRSEHAGVFCGTVKSRTGDEVVLTNARRIWFWEGAASLSQLAMEGTSAPKKCKFPIEVDEVLLLGLIECIPMSAEAIASIASVPIWEK